MDYDRVTDEQLREILGLEDDVPLDPEGFKSIEVCAGYWSKQCDGMWHFKEWVEQ